MVTPETPEGTLGEEPAPGIMVLLVRLESKPYGRSQTCRPFLIRGVIE